MVVEEVVDVVGDQARTFVVDNEEVSEAAAVGEVGASTRQ